MGNRGAIHVVKCWFCDNLILIFDTSIYLTFKNTR